MTTVRFKASEIPPLTPEDKERIRALANLTDEEIDCSGPDDYEATDEELACSVRICDYPTEEDAIRESDHLADLHRAGMSLDEIRAYKKSRVRQLATV